MTITEKIQSLRDQVGAGYTKPSSEKISEFKNALKESQRAQDYLQITRNLTQDTIEHFNLGYDKDKDAIAIPVYKRGELINIRYRFIDDEKKPKYTQEKGAEVWIYNEDGIQKGKERGGVLVVEGEFDLMSVWQSGIKNVISPASGKESYGIWLELLDSIPKVYIAYDNDKPGKQASIDMAERVGTDKAFEVLYPEGIKDANDYFKQKNIDDFKALIKSARPYYKYKFAGVTDVISALREKKATSLKLKSVPFVEFEEDWMVILSGTSNIGKTTMAMNVADELVNKNIPTLILPFERGVKDVGKRFVQVRYKKTKEEFEYMDDNDWDTLVKDAVELPLYFSMPKIEEIRETLTKAKRIFNIKFVIVDHLNYLVRKSDNNENAETSRTLQEFKSLAQELQVIFLVIHHIRKPAIMGVQVRKPQMEDLKGSSSTYQDPEAVVMLSSPNRGQIEVDVVKNKGDMGSKVYEFNYGTGNIDFENEIYTETADDKQKEIDSKKWFDSLPQKP